MIKKNFHLFFLFRNLFKKNRVLFSLITVMLSLVFLFAYVGVLACHADSYFVLQNAVGENDNLVFTSRYGMTVEEFKKIFPDDVFFSTGYGDLVYLETLPDDGKIYANEEVVKTNFTLGIDSNIDFEKDLIIDNTLDIPFFATGSIPYNKTETKSYLSYKGSLWGTEKHKASYFTKYANILFTPVSYYKKIEGNEIPFQLEDNVFYVGDPDLVPKDGTPIFEDKYYFSINDSVSSKYATMFDDLQVKFIPSSLGFNSLNIYVSDHTMEVLQSNYQYDTALIQLKNNRNAILSFLASHKFTIEKTLGSKNRRSLEPYNRVCEWVVNSRGNANYQEFTYIMPVIGLLIVWVAVEFLLNENKENIINLRLQGESRKNIIILFSSPFILSVFLSLSVGIVLAYMITKTEFTALGFGIPYFLVICLVTFLIPLFSILRRWKND